MKPPTALIQAPKNYLKLPPAIAVKRPITLAIKVLKLRYVFKFIPDSSVLISGIPEPSDSSDIKYPTQVAIKIRTIPERHQKKKLNTLLSDEDISILAS
jgi:hypothetical protein